MIPFNSKANELVLQVLVRLILTNIIPKQKNTVQLYFYKCAKLLCIFNGTPLQYSCLENPMDGGACWAAVHGVTKSRIRLSDFTSTFHFHALEKEMATHSFSCLENPRAGEPGGLPSMGSHRVRHDWSDLAAAILIYFPMQMEKKDSHNNDKYCFLKLDDLGVNIYYIILYICLEYFSSYY